jgi:hypothetical protein
MYTHGAANMERRVEVADTRLRQQQGLNYGGGAT